MNVQIAQNLKILMTRVKLSEHELSRRTGVKQPIIHRLLNGTNTNPKLETIHPIAHYFTITVSQLIGETPLFENTAEIVEKKQILSDWKAVPVMSKKTINQWVMVNCALSEKTFAIQVGNKNMEPLIPQMAIVIIEPTLPPVTGDFVLIKEKSELLLKYYVKKGSKVFLFSSLGHLDSLETVSPVLGKNKISGTVIRTIYDRKNAFIG